MVSLDVENTIKKKISEIEDAETKLSSESNSECKNLVIAKQYMDIDELYIHVNAYAYVCLSMCASRLCT